MSQNELTEFTPLNVIRTETVLSRFPIHNLSKRGKIDIHIKQQNNKGELELYWDVSFSEKHGQARQLAYKLDTLIINRRIEEAGKPTPRIIRLGSLRDICEELGLTEGKNTQAVKKALLQNASTFITAKITYKGFDGKEKILEAAFNKYNLVFTGEKLPNGSKADAVYLILSDIYKEVLDNAQVRPLDFNYLKTLSPTAQRWYEVVSYSIFAANKHKLSTADILYSEYCMYSGQERFTERKKVYDQLRKLHAPHLKSGYINKFNCELVRNADGKSDWILKYTPGQKAKAEYKTFTTPNRNKKLKPIDVGAEAITTSPAQARRFDIPKPVEPKPEEQPPTISADQQQLINKLVESFGIHEKKAFELVIHNQQSVETQVEIFPYRVKGNIKDEAAYMVRAIEKNYAPPKNYLEQKARKEREAAAAKAKALQDAREKHETKYQLTYRHYLANRETEIESLYSDVYDEFLSWKEVRRTQSITTRVPNLVEIQMRLFDKVENQFLLFVEFFSKRRECRVFDFWQWDEKLNPNRFSV